MGEPARRVVRKSYLLQPLGTVMALHLFSSDLLFDGDCLSTATEKLLPSRKRSGHLLRGFPDLDGPVADNYRLNKLLAASIVHSLASYSFIINI
jgi:hypothetical protein